MRFVVAKRRGLRGEGLGNELFAWAKGWIASQVLDARLIGPSWGLNPREYYRNFQTSRWDFLWEELGTRLPHYEFTEEDYRATEETDFGSAITVWARNKKIRPRQSYIVTVDGMYGGYPAIASARDFLECKLLQSRDTLRNMRLVKAGLDKNKLFVAVHMRSGSDFTPHKSTENIRGLFNVKVPDEWYLYVCSMLEQTFRAQVQFRVFTDRKSRGFQEAVRRFSPRQVHCSGLTECSDLLLMAHADLRVCSVSSYSLAASYLSGGPYIWYEPQLNVRNDMYSLWPHESAQQHDNSLSNQSQRFVRQLAMEYPSDQKPLHLGTAMAVGDELHQDLKHCLRERLRLLEDRTDLLMYGAVPTRLHDERYCKPE